MENGSDVESPGQPLRAGASILSLFAAPLNTLVLRALAERPMRLANLRRETGWPPQSTLRGNLAGLLEIGALERRSRAGNPNAIENDLTTLGRELLFVADRLEAWLAKGPRGPVALDSEYAKAAIKALAGGWGSTILRALAAEPLCLTELDRLIDEVSYPALERRLATMRATGQVEVLPDGGHHTLYTVTDWSRHAAAPLVAAGRCERRHMAAQTAPVTPIEVEAAFLLAIPLVTLPADAEGACSLVVTTNGGDGESKPGLAGVHVEVEGGRVVAWDTELKPGPPSWALGTLEMWFDAVIDGRLDRLRLGGADPPLARNLVRDIHEALYG